MKNFIFIWLMLSVCTLKAQTGKLLYIKLDEWAKDERFDKLQITIPFYLVQNDTIETLDFESMRESKKIRIIKPEGHASYAYGYLFFNGIPNAENPGHVNILMVDIAERDPKLYIDRNNNYDFTDDGAPRHVPMPFNRKESVLIELGRSDNPEAKVAIRLSRMDFSTKYSYKNLLNEYYEIYNNGRTFVGIEYCFREQRYQTRCGWVKMADDSFRIALQDDNGNGLYNEVGIDKLITANYNDTVFESKDELRSMVMGEAATEKRFEKNGKLFQIIQVDPAGTYITLEEIADSLQGTRIAVGKKVPNCAFIDWEGKKYKLKQFRKHNVYIYYTGPAAKGFTQDTATLRTIAEEFNECVKVIGFIDVNKSYELKIFGGYSNLNWIAAYKNKYVTRDLQIRGIPSGLWLGKRRKVKAYNVTPTQLLEELRKKSVGKSR